MSEIFVPRSLQELALEWPEDLDHISASSLKMAVRCPEQWRQRYVLGRMTPPSPELINGRANHAAIEYSMLQKLDSHEDLPVGAVSAYYDNDFDQIIEEAGGVGEVEVREGGELVKAQVAKTKYLDNLRRDGRGLVTYYHRTESPYIQPRAVEKEFEIRPATLPVKVVGRIDLLATDSTMESPDVIIDRKTTKKKKYRVEPEWNVQAEIYQLVEPVDHHWHVSSYQPGPLVQTEFNAKPRPRQIAELTLDHVVGQIGYFYRRYGPDVPWPAHGKTHTWACGYCGYRPDCWAWREDE